MLDGLNISTILELNVAGASGAEAEIKLRSFVTLTAADFVL